MDRLDALEAKSIAIFREAYSELDRVAMLWSLGKDSNAMVWLAKKAFFGYVPFPVAHVDTGLEFPEVYAFRTRYAAEWGLDLIVAPCPPIEAMDPTLPPAARSASRKTAGLKQLIEARGFTGIVAGIRRDEEGTRAKERVFSPRGSDAAWNFRDQPPELWSHYNLDPPPGTHLRVHPLLHWTELDVWRYIRRENIPVVSLYFAADGRRYRSLGCAPCTQSIASHAANVDDIIAELGATTVAERSGRAQDRESEGAFEELRANGYM